MQNMQGVVVPRTEHDEVARGCIGATVCGWTIEGALGQGPVCRSWLAVRGSERAVVRVLREPLAADERVRTEWLRASWAANRFYHARVVKVIEQGADEQGAPVIVRGWAKGITLGEVVRQGPVDARSALRFIERLLDALEMAHAHGIVHGALSTSNVVITPRGSVRLVDFATTPGLLERAAGKADPLVEARSGPFMAPERRSTPLAPPSEQADVWSVGACLHFAMTGETPPDGRRELPELASCAGMNQDIAAVIRLALAHDPLERYESAYAMLGDVRRLVAGRKPKLDASLAPVPSQNLTDARSAPPQSSSGIWGLRAEAESAPGSPRNTVAERRGNILLMIAIALVVGTATFVMMRERLAEGPGTTQPAPR
jgi:serine/threonine protein kinase